MFTAYAFYFEITDSEFYSRVGLKFHFFVQAVYIKAGDERPFILFGSLFFYDRGYSCDLDLAETKSARFCYSVIVPEFVTIFKEASHHIFRTCAPVKFICVGYKCRRVCGLFEAMGR